MDLARRQPSRPLDPEIACLKLEDEIFELSGPCLAWIARGRAHLRCGLDSWSLGEGDLLTIGPRVECTLGGRRSSAELIAFRPPSRWLEDAASLGGAEIGFVATLPAVDRAGTDTARRAERMLRELLLPAAVQGVADSLRRNALRMQLAALVLEHRPESFSLTTVRRAATVRRHALQRALEAFTDGPLDQLSLTAIADRLGLSERQASRLLQRQLGISFRAHAQGVRIERAKHLLSTTELSIIEVAAETGWRSLAHFNAVFRRRVGVTPTRFRDSVRSAEEPVAIPAERVQ